MLREHTQERFDRLMRIIDQLQADNDLEIAVIEHLDFEPECEDLGHPTGGSGHDSGPARFLVTAPCGFAEMICAGYAKYILTFEYLGCRICGGRHRRSEFTLTPLGGA